MLTGVGNTQGLNRSHNVGKRHNEFSRFSFRSIYEVDNPEIWPSTNDSKPVRPRMHNFPIVFSSWV
jgi:hypothetical protein